MPSFAPRTEPEKKMEELTKRETALFYALKKDLPNEKISVAIEKYRKAQLSLIKARTHVAMDRVYKLSLTDFSFDKFTEETINWSKKTVDEIISEFKIKFADKLA